jgi:hypothetical protein
VKNNNRLQAPCKAKKELPPRQIPAVASLRTIRAHVLPLDWTAPLKCIAPGLTPRVPALWYDALDRGRTEAFPLSMGPMKTETLAEEKAVPRRRSTRILLRVPLIINVVGDSVETEWEPVETITVSQHGAMVRAKQEFRVGDTLEIRVRNKDRSARARVAWRSTQVTPQGVELGFEILDEEGFWEISFPPDRWSAKTTPRSGKP